MRTPLDSHSLYVISYIAHLLQLFQVQMLSSAFRVYNILRTCAHTHVHMHTLLPPQW